jgi:hypothetical protein
MLEAPMDNKRKGILEQAPSFGVSFYIRLKLDKRRRDLLYPRSNGAKRYSSMPTGKKTENYPQKICTLCEMSTRWHFSKDMLRPQIG